MTLRTKIEVTDWLKIGAMAVSLIGYGVLMRKDIDVLAQGFTEQKAAQARTLERVETKVDALLASNARMDVLATRIEENARRLERLEKIEHEAKVRK